MNIIIATIHDWNIRNYYKWKEPEGYKKHLITDKENLKLENVKKINPKYIFSPHWSWKIPQKIWSNYECIVFHMTDLPYGRGGTPLQNLLMRGVYKTKISAIRVSKDFDSGDLYIKEALDISTGSAGEIYEKASKIIYKMINKIVMKNLVPKKQSGKITYFKRRIPDQSRVPEDISTRRKLYDFIRMLDAPGYPKAYIKFNNFKIEFSNAIMSDKYLKCDALVINNKSDK